MIIEWPAGLMAPLPLGTLLPADPEKASNLSKLPFVSYATFSLAKSGWPKLENPSNVIQCVQFLDMHQSHATSGAHLRSMTPASVVQLT